MSGWNPEKYLLFQKQRTQPAIDLANRIRDLNPGKIADLGCGPGNSTMVLHTVFPEADLVGLDSSPEMIERASSLYPGLRFSLCPVEELSGEYDLLFSNACLQWVSDHEKLLPGLMSHLADGGVLAVQMPMNRDEALYRIIREVAAESEWNLFSASPENNDILLPEKYHDILSACASSFEMWQTIYHHVLPSHQSLIEWVRSTRLRPYLELLNPEGQRVFEDRILQKTKDAYPLTGNGEVVFHFQRLFFLAWRG